MIEGWSGLTTRNVNVTAILSDETGGYHIGDGGTTMKIPGGGVGSDKVGH